MNNIIKFHPITFHSFSRLVLLFLGLMPGLSAVSQSAVPAPASSANATSAKVEVYFSPKGGAQAAIIREIDAANHSIRIQAYSYTSEPISQALLRALSEA